MGLMTSAMWYFALSALIVKLLSCIPVSVSVIHGWHWHTVTLFMPSHSSKRNRQVINYNMTHTTYVFVLSWKWGNNINGHVMHPIKTHPGTNYKEGPCRLRQNMASKGYCVNHRNKAHRNKASVCGTFMTNRINNLPALAEHKRATELNAQVHTQKSPDIPK